MQKQELSMLSLARKAGKLVLGFDKTADGLKDGTVKGLFYSADLSEKSKKELHFIGAKAQIEPLELSVSMEEVSTVCGKRSGVIALTDEGFAKKIASFSKTKA